MAGLLGGRVVRLLGLDVQVAGCLAVEGSDWKDGIGGHANGFDGMGGGVRGERHRQGTCGTPEVRPSERPSVRASERPSVRPPDCPTARV